MRNWLRNFSQVNRQYLVLKRHISNACLQDSTLSKHTTTRFQALHNSLRRHAQLAAYITIAFATDIVSRMRYTAACALEFSETHDINELRKTNTTTLQHQTPNAFEQGVCCKVLATCNDTNTYPLSRIKHGGRRVDIAFRVPGKTNL